MVAVGDERGAAEAPAGARAEFGAAVLAFGLIHGLGLSARLQDLGLPDEGLVEQAQPGGLGGGHPAKPFFEPDEAAPAEDLAHVIGDGYVIVRYDPDAPAGDVDALRSFVEETGGQFIAAAPADDQQTEPLFAVTALKTLTCEEFDVEGLRSFYDEWLEFVRSRAGG